jgi:hypothetical protein
MSSSRCLAQLYILLPLFDIPCDSFPAFWWHPLAGGNGYRSDNFPCEFMIGTPIEVTLHEKALLTT